MHVIRLSDDEILSGSAIHSYKITQREVETERLEPVSPTADKVIRGTATETVLTLTRNDGKTMKFYGERADRIIADLKAAGF